MINIVDVIGRVVAQMQQGWDAQAENPERPYFMHGPYLEMVNTLVEKDKGQLTKLRKYPAVMLPQPFDVVETSSGCQATLTIVILALSKKDAKTNDRYDYTFNPTLFPLAALLKQELLNSIEINETDINFNYSEHPYWRTDGQGNMANDYIDAIEITNLKLNFIKNC